MTGYHERVRGRGPASAAPRGILKENGMCPEHEHEHASETVPPPHASRPPAPWTDRDIAIRQHANDPASDPTMVPETDGAALPDRSDAALVNEIEQRIEARLGADAHDLQVTVDDAAVTLEGPVRERATKEVVGALVDAIPDVRAVDNRLLVDWVDGTPSAERAASATSPPPDADYLESTEGSPTSTERRAGK